MDSQTLKRYTGLQWRTLIILMVGYVCYYFLRKNFSAAIPAMEASLGLSKVQLGAFLTLNGIVYGLSRMVNGVLADRFSKKMIMALGLALSCLINLAICFSPKLNGMMNLLDAEGKATLGLVYLIGSLWVVNGYVHGMGYPPCASIMAHWFRPSELATKQSIWNSSHSIGAGIVIALCGWILSRWGYGAWNLCFIIPAIISFLGAALVFFGLKDEPAQYGLPPLEVLDNRVPFGGEKESAHPLSRESYRIFVSRMVFRNPVIWGISLSNFCVYVIRFTILEWGTSFLTQYKGMEIALAASIVAASELVGGVLGTIVSGWMTDRLLQSKTLRTSAIFTLGATLSFAGFWLVPSEAHWIWSAILIVLSAFFIYGPQALLGVSCSQYATKRAAGSANGFCGIFGYAATAISGIGFGYLADHPGFGWNAVFIVAIAFGLIGVAVLFSYWKAPANGYAKAAKVLEEIGAS